MPRPRRRRRVGREPDTDYFKPAGVRKKDLEEIVMSVAEAEALRLKDREELEQEEAADKMDVSQPTFNRILTSARKKVSEAVLEGKVLKIEGGEYVVDED